MKLALKALQQLVDTPPWDWPEHTATDLLAVLRDDSAGEEERLLAVELAGNSVVINDDLVRALLATVERDRDSERVRALAAISLGPTLERGDVEGFSDPASVPISEGTFHDIQKTLRALYFDASVPKLVRRRILESSVRSPMAWHGDALRGAYTSGDEEWKATAVFGMRHVSGFDKEIVTSLKSTSPEIHVEAVLAAGAWAIDAAWEHVVDLVNSEATDKPLLLAAIEAVGQIRPRAALETLQHLEGSDDADIAEAASEAISMSCEWGEDDDLDDLDDLIDLLDEDLGRPN